MIANLKPYPAYKESGSEWLGSIPASWEVRSLRTLIRRRNERNRVDLPLLSVAREKGVFVRSLTDPDENHNVIPEDLTNYKVARAGNLVINKMKAWQGSMGIAPCDGIVSPAYYVFDLDIENRMFAQRLFRSRHYIAHFAQASDGVRVGQWDLSIAGMREIPVLLPNAREQAAIVRFLDWASGRLERAIRAKRKVIALLNEEKRFIIHRAVTLGLNASVPLKPTGLDLPRERPAHWKSAIKIKFISSLKGRLGWQGLKASEYSDHGPYVVSSAHYKNEKIDWKKCPHVTEERYELDKNIQLSEGDILLMKDGASMGKLAFVNALPGKACLNSHLLLFRPFVANGQKSYDPKFLFYFMLTQPFQTYVQVNGTGSTFPGVSQEALGNFKICLPPIEEQPAIVRFLDIETARQDKAIELEEKQIQLIREYGTRLVTDVVTGKLDVCHAAAHLVNETAPRMDEDDNDLSTDAEATEEEEAAV